MHPSLFYQSVSNPLPVFVVHLIFISLCICPGEQRVHSQDVELLQTWVWCLWKTAFNGSEASTSSKLAPKQGPVMGKEEGVCKVNVFSIPLMPQTFPCTCPHSWRYVKLRHRTEPPMLSASHKERPHYERKRQTRRQPPLNPIHLTDTSATDLPVSFDVTKSMSHQHNSFSNKGCILPLKVERQHFPAKYPS